MGPGGAGGVGEPCDVTSLSLNYNNSSLMPGARAASHASASEKDGRAATAEAEASYVAGFPVPLPLPPGPPVRLD